MRLDPGAPGVLAGLNRGGPLIEGGLGVGGAGARVGDLLGELVVIPSAPGTTMSSLTASMSPSPVTQTP